MLEEVLKHGYIAASEVIIRTYKRIEQSPSKCMIQKYYMYLLAFLFSFSIFFKSCFLLFLYNIINFKIFCTNYLNVF